MYLKKKKKTYRSVWLAEVTKANSLTGKHIFQDFGVLLSLQTKEEKPWKNNEVQEIIENAAAVKHPCYLTLVL